MIPQAGAVDREARVSVGPRRNHDDEVRNRARTLPLPQVRLDRRGHHGSVFADRALAAAGRHARAPAAQRGGRPRRRPSGTLRTRTTAASCGASSPTASGSKGSPGGSGQRPQAALAPSSTPSWPAAEDRAPRAGSPLWPTRGWTSQACRRTAP